MTDPATPPAEEVPRPDGWHRKCSTAGVHCCKAGAEACPDPCPWHAAWPALYAAVVQPLLDQAAKDRAEIESLRRIARNDPLNVDDLHRRAVLASTTDRSDDEGQR